MTLNTEISIPKDTVNDDEVLITDILLADGVAVAKGEPLLVYESSKASVEVEAPVAGYVVFRCTEGEYAAVGSVVAVITDATTGNSLIEANQPEAAESVSQRAAPIFSKAAARFMQARDISPELFAGQDLVSLEDVLTVTGQEQSADGRIPVFILGGGGHGLVLGDLVACNPAFRLRGYLDDGKVRGDVVDGFPVLGIISDLTDICHQHAAVALIAAGLVDPDPTLRIRLFDHAQTSGALLPPFIHASATVDPRATLGRGVQIHAGTVVGPGAVLGDGVVVNSGAIVSHHCHIGSHSHIAPGAILAGGVTIGTGCLIGMGVTAYIGITIGDASVIENGVDLLKSVPKGARITKR